MLRKSYDTLYGIARAIIIVLLVLLALYVSLGRHYVGYISTYREQAIAQFNEATGLELKSAAFIGSWSGLSPIIEIEDFSLAGAPGAAPALIAEKIEIELDVLSSLLNRRPEISHADIDGLELFLAQSEAKRWGLAGFAGGGGELPEWLVDSLLAVKFTDVRDARVGMLFSGGGRTEIVLPTARFASDGHFRRMVVQLALEDSGPVHVIAESEADPRDLKNFQTSAYLQLDAARFGALANVLPAKYAALLKTQASGQVWIRRGDNQQVLVSGNLTSPEFAVGTFWQKPGQVIANTRSVFSATYDENEWSVWFAEAGLNWGEERLELNNFQLRGRDGDSRVKSYIPEVRVGQLLGILRDGPIPESLDTLLEELSPEGTLRNVAIGVDISSADFNSLLATAELHDVSLNAWRGAPGAKGINGWVEAGISKGRLLLDTDAFELEFPYLYDKPLTLENARAEVMWEIDDKRVVVESGVIEAKDDGADVAAVVALDLPLKKGDEKPQMMLSIGLSNADVSVRNNYIPKTLSAPLRGWLDNSILDGHINHVGFVWRGATSGAVPEDRTIQLFADVRGVGLKFHEDWPAARSVKTIVLLDDADVRTIDASAKLFENIEVSDLDVKVRPHRGVSRLFVRAKAQGDLPAVLKLYRRSPLSGMTGGVFNDWAGTGAAHIDLNLRIPLAGNGAAGVFDVDAVLPGNSIEIGGLNLGVKKLKGAIKYKNGTVSSSNLRGEVFGRRADIAITQKAGGPVITTAKARVPVNAIERWLSQPVFTLLSGEAPMTVVVTAGGDRAGVLVESDLDGISIDVPAPFTKLADEKRKLRLVMPLSGELRTMRTEIQGLGNIALQFNGGSTDGIAVTLGHSDQLAVSYPKAITVSGSINGTELLLWQPVLDRYLQAVEQQAAQSGAASNAPWQVRVENFGVGVLDLAGLHLEELVVSAISPMRADERWEVDVIGPTISGRVLLPNSDSEPLDVKLQRLVLPEALLEQGDKDVAATKAPPSSPFDPGSLPLMDFYTAQLELGSDNLGSVGFQLRPVAGAAMLRNIRGNLRGVHISGADMVWTGAGQDREETTEFTGNLLIPNLGNTLQAFHYERIVEAKDARSNVSLKWPGGPQQFDLINSEGFFGVVTDKGRLPSAPDNATGALRIVGIFNLANLIRRMQFDFSDLFEKGIAFDRIKGRVSLAGGVMHFPGGFELKGPSSRFILNGNVDFNNDQTDMQLVATLPVASNLPWVAALVGGLPAAAGVYVASKLFEKQVDRFSSAVYDISGPWQDPKLKFRKVFDDTSPAETPVPASMASDDGN